MASKVSVVDLPLVQRVFLYPELNLLHSIGLAIFSYGVSSHESLQGYVRQSHLADLWLHLPEMVSPRRFSSCHFRLMRL